MKRRTGGPRFDATGICDRIRGTCLRCSRSAGVVTGDAGVQSESPAKQVTRIVRTPAVQFRRQVEAEDFLAALVKPSL